nr:glycosyltransferase family 2 protein [Saliphagus infecundisoli]
MDGTESSRSTPMIETVLIAVLGASSLLAAHSYVLYPLALYGFVAAGRGSNPDRTGDLPTVSLVVAAYNEEEVIAEKIENSLELDYPEDRLEIVVFSDASTDRTDEIVRSYEDSGVSLLRIEGRVGKTECQNRAVTATDGEVIVFSDANSMYEPDAIRHLVAGFGEGVGCVAGELQYRDESEVEGESMYWRYESWIKGLESAFHSTVTGNGSIYAVRRSAYVPLPAEAISDFAEPLAIVGEGGRIAYEPDAVAWEDTGTSVGEELGRRSRIVTRSWHTVASYAHLLNPLSYPTFAFQLWSHKVLRWLTPVFLGAILVSTLGLVAVSPSPLSVAVLGAQLVCYGLAAAGAALDRAGRETPTVVHVPYYFLVANYGMARGLANFLHGRNIVTWETVSRDD